MPSSYKSNVKIFRTGLDFATGAEQSEVRFREHAKNTFAILRCTSQQHLYRSDASYAASFQPQVSSLFPSYTVRVVQYCIMFVLTTTIAGNIN